MADDQLQKILADGRREALSMASQPIEEIMRNFRDDVRQQIQRNCEYLRTAVNWDIHKS